MSDTNGDMEGGRDGRSERGETEREGEEIGRPPLLEEAGITVGVAACRTEGDRSAGTEGDWVVPDGIKCSEGEGANEEAERDE